MLSLVETNQNAPKRYPKKEPIISQAPFFTGFCFWFLRKVLSRLPKPVDFDTNLVPTHSSSGSRFLDGKCAFRFVFNASSPKPGSLVDTLTCNELPGEMENFHKQGEGGVEMYRVAKGINLKIREESKDQPEKANNKRYSKLVSEIHIEILIYLFVSTFCFEIVK